MSEVPLYLITCATSLCSQAGFTMAAPHVGLRPFHQKSTCITQLTAGPYLVQIWSRSTPQNRGERNPRSPPCGYPHGQEVAKVQGYLTHKKQRPPKTLQ